MAEVKTRVISIDPALPDHAAIQEAAILICAGELVAFPTETVYGLGGDGLNPESLRRIYTVKGRPSDNPLILHIASPQQLRLVAAEASAMADTLMHIFWPGPLTLILPKTTAVPDLATGGLATVAVRMPDHPVALALIHQAGTALAGPSANRSGCPSPTTAQHVLDDLDGRIALVLDAGSTLIGVESTVLDITCSPPVILRPGGISQEAIEAAIGPLGKRPEAAAYRRSPGMRYRHYSPRARVLLLEDTTPDSLQLAVDAARSRHQRVGCVLHRLASVAVPSGVMIKRTGGSVADYAHGLFAALRDLDMLGVEVIIVEGVAEEGLGSAVMDRLRRAASPPNV
jgi:L-threonylcarbamoyladenylate synthase